MKNKNIKNNKIFKRLLVMAVLVFALLLGGCGNKTQSIGVDSIQISKKNLYLAEGQTAVISAQVYPYNATNQNYRFEVNNTNVVTVEDGFVTAKSAGDAVIYVYSEEGGYKDSCNVLVTTANDNLALNNYNNLNMPQKDLKPIYNPNDYSGQHTKNTTQSPSLQSAKNTANKLKAKSLSKKFFTNSQNSKKSQGIGDWSKNIAKQVDAQICTDAECAKDVLSQVKAELKNSINSITNEASQIANFYDGWNNDIATSFANIQAQVLESIKLAKQAMLDDIESLQSKIDSGEYVVESTNQNGVTFVAIRNNLSKNDATSSQQTA